MRFEKLKPRQGGDGKKGRVIRTRNDIDKLIHLHPRKNLKKIKDIKDIYLSYK